ncbi:hypothetical protein NUU61_006801 [Penicillium alfredii]|uniref:RNA helicase n=1 Tax=Penicillium alfredii TaxID=1506179 RepID=A0A9W9F1U7_9EURO|nr:uncharacterized protein NUU61_006801 [Penicillium alfredii]KAJ5091931.1 hypothetical protein NUU61_006801 [Penicillium alfredii]
MQSWTGTGSRSLFCALRTLARPTERPFMTTSVLQRSKRGKPKDTNTADAKKAAKVCPRVPESTVAKALSVASPKKSVRQNVAAARDFNNVVAAALRDVRYKLHQANASLARWDQFERQTLNACLADDSKTGAKWGPLRHIKVSLQKAYLTSGVQGLRDELEYMMYADGLTAKYSTPNLQEQMKVADCRYPAEWYPHARSIQRTIHLHVGPTNSGKTYHALQRLKNCKNGFYAGPLRLLAQEVYHRFKGDGVPCSLVTGDDVKVPEDGELPRVVSNTVEMVSLGQKYDVGVIDEIQMIANSKRGWAWTRAVLGSQVSELHLCGETRAVPLIRELCALTGDILEIHRYERLNPLEVMDHSLKGNLNNLEKGDCLVAFSRVGIHALKADIEKTTGRRAAIVYGGLPAEIRTQQASLFNDPDNEYDFLVASDAIGMGLNLSCKRVIFETVVKRLPSGLHRLTVPEIKQIGGRAGRYRPANAQGDADGKANVGLVTSLEEVDLPYIQQAMRLEPPPLSAAGIYPPESAFLKFAAYFPPKSVPFEYLLKRLLDISQVSSTFFMCDASDQLSNAEIIDSVDGLRTEDQLVLMTSPMDNKDPSSRDVTCALGDCVANHTDGRLLDIPHLNLEILEQAASGNRDYMHELEKLHKAVILYSWLSFRFGGVFTDRTLAAHVKELVEARMVRALTEFSANKKLRKDSSLRRQIALQKQILDQQRIISDADLMSPHGEGNQMNVDFSEEGAMEKPEKSTLGSASLEDGSSAEDSFEEKPPEAQASSG